MRFRATIEQAGKTATGIEVPEKVVIALGSSKRPAVRATINGYTYSSSVPSMGGRFMLGVSAEVRQKARVAGGDQVNVDLELDTEPREVTVPPDFAKALKADLKAKKFFDGLSYSYRRRFVLSIEGAKSQETRDRRIAQSVASLHAGKTS